MWFWVIKRSITGALFVAAICAFIFNPLSYINPEAKSAMDELKAFLPLIAFGGTFIAGIIGFLIQWWVTGKPEYYPDTNERLRLLESKIRLLEEKSKDKHEKTNKKDKAIRENRDN